MKRILVLMLISTMMLTAFLSLSVAEGVTKITANTTSTTPGPDVTKSSTTETTTTPGFEAAFMLVGILAVAFIALRKRL